MKQVININFHGQVVPIEVSAFDLLKGYTDSLARHFANEEGKEEIINDIESRIAELFQERLKKGATCITEEDVNAIINSMGRPEEFDADEEEPVSGFTSGNQQNSGNRTQATARRLYRNENDKILGGVCSGIASYFGIDPIIVRILFVVITLALGTGLLAYIIMWVAVPSSASVEIGGVRKKLFRDSDDKMIAGVCSGLGNYFGIHPWIPRLLFLLPFLSFAFHWRNVGFMDLPDIVNFTFSPGSLIVYIILWLVIPEALTTTEKLEMKGEKVDMNSIKNSVMEEMKGFQKRAEKLGQEAKNIAETRGAQMGEDIKSAARRSSKSLGDIIAMIVKGFVYFILGTIGFSLVVALFALAVFSIGVFPLKDFVLTEGWQNLLAWGTLVFFIAVPVIGIITWLIRKLAKIKTSSKLLRFSFIGLWIIGWACFMSLLAFVSKDFRSGSSLVEQEIKLSNPRVNRLDVTNLASGRIKYKNGYFRLQPFYGITEDTAYVQNISVKIVKSNADTFRVTMMKLACGRTKRMADTLAGLIQFNVVQQDSLLILDKGIAINRNDKFRNQRVIVTVYMPVGKTILVNRDLGWGNGRISFGDDDVLDIDLDNEEEGWERGVEYVMKADGLYTLDGKPADEWRHEQRNKVKVGPGGVEVQDGGSRVKVGPGGVEVEDTPGTYRYDNSQPLKAIDSLKQKVEQETRRVEDSLQKVKQQIEEQLQKVRTKNQGEPVAYGNFPMLLINPIAGSF